MKTKADLYATIEKMLDDSMDTILDTRDCERSSIGYDKDGWNIEYTYDCELDEDGRPDITAFNFEAWHYDEDLDIETDFDESTILNAKRKITSEIENILYDL